MNATRFCSPLATSFGEVAIIWYRTDQGPRVHRIGLGTAECQERGAAPAPAIADLGRQIQHALAGRPVAFEPELLDLQGCSTFQQQVLRAEQAIPRGWVSTYGRLAIHLGLTGGARAVGGALARNPFPIVIPCHRTICSDGIIGGYQGGVAMKRALLQMEGVTFSASGRVIETRMYY